MAPARSSAPSSVWSSALSNLMATGQIQCHDRIRVTHIDESPALTFFRENSAWGTWKTDGVAA